MSSPGGSVDEIEVSPAIFTELSNLEKEFAEVELDALRRKEHALQPLYNRRAKHLSQIPGFWPQVLLNGPQEFQSILDLDSAEDDSTDTNLDLATISAIENLTVERHGIKSASEGEPRSLRFIFEFGKNDIFEDTRVVKEFNYVSYDDGESGALVSKPVTFKWTKKGKKLMSARTGNVLDLAFDLSAAEEAATLTIAGKKGSKGREVDMVKRETLWQYEKLRSKLEEVENSRESEKTWLEWFGYRGPVEPETKPASTSKDTATNGNKSQNGNGNGIKSADEDEDAFDEFEDEDTDGTNLLDVEIFPSGEELALALAEDLWPNVMDYFMASQEPDDDDADEIESISEEEDDDDEEAPALIDTADTASGPEEADINTRPSKKQRTN